MLESVVFFLPSVISTTSIDFSSTVFSAMAVMSFSSPAPSGRLTVFVTVFPIVFPLSFAVNVNVSSAGSISPFSSKVPASMFIESHIILPSEYFPPEVIESSIILIPSSDRSISVGNVSVTVVVIPFNPLFLTVIVYSILSPAFTLLFVASFSTESTSFI